MKNREILTHISCTHCGESTVKRIPLPDLSGFEVGWFFCINCAYKIFLKPEEDKRAA